MENIMIFFVNRALPLPEIETFEVLIPWEKKLSHFFVVLYRWIWFILESYGKYKQDKILNLKMFCSKYLKTSESDF